MVLPVLRDFEGVTGESAATNGERVFAAQGITGVRGEAASGFENVRRHGLPVLVKMIGEGHSLNDAGVAALLSMMAYVEDTNVIRRSNVAALRELQASLRDFLADNPTAESILKKAELLDKEFIAENISPGGSADLLAAAYFVYYAFGHANPPHNVCRDDY